VTKAVEALKAAFARGILSIVAAKTFGQAHAGAFE
jgi:hypothetical protein